MRLGVALESSRLTIRTIDRGDLTAVEALMANAEARSMMVGSDIHAWAENASMSPAELPFVLSLVADGPLVGIVHVKVKTESHPTAYSILVGELLFAIHPDHRGHGYAAESVRTVNHWCLYEMEPSVLGYPMRRMIGLCAATNLASARSMINAGMTEEPVLEGSVTIHDATVRGVRRFARDGKPFAG